jgi:uncharacterized protein DUF6510
MGVSGMTAEELRLDGNAIAGTMRDIFSFDITIARAACSECRAVGEMGAQPTYVQAPGVVIRCRQCDHVLARLVQGPGRYWLDLGGVSFLELREVG